jgi:hypothetical protein
MLLGSVFYVDYDTHAWLPSLVVKFVLFRLCVTLLAVGVQLLLIVHHYMFRTDWPPSDVQVVMKEAASLL